ncbi:hypothetical protein E3T55_01715 [Cryobacterium frigoriphilum]|uniref:Uncharacterized protein n=1 Tax=Cryobacterium frigoriphilum TaxID=1259150 RepID=A0A4R9AAX8_9MICO|nr:hypothetical protein [Cryobacterium frigoriphilum]TFD55164.1 hypothetical protein E3T55_01715 [Cryobacterium frigoriphilum]
MKHLSFLPKKSPIRARAVLAAGAVLGLGAVLTFASFTDEGYVASTFSTGTVDITFDASEADGPIGAPHTTQLGFTVGKIGSSTIAPLTVNNSGTLPFDYTMSTTTTGGAALASGLRVTVVSLGAPATAGACNATTTFTPAIQTGTDLGSTALSGRSLNAQTSEVLCFKVELPSGSNDNAMQDLSTTATFAFAATQQP